MCIEKKQKQITRSNDDGDEKKNEFPSQGDCA